MKINKILACLLFLVHAGQASESTLPELKLETIKLSQVLTKFPDISESQPTWGVHDNVTGSVFFLNGEIFEIRSFFWESKEKLQKSFGEFLKETKQQDITPEVINMGYGPILVYKIRPPKDGLASLMIKPKLSLEEMQIYPIERRDLPTCNQHKYAHIQLGDALKVLPLFAQQKPRSFTSWEVGTSITLNNEKFQVLQAFFDDPLQNISDMDLKKFVELKELYNMTSQTVEYGNAVQEIFYRPAFDHDDRIVFYLSLRRYNI